MALHGQMSNHAQLMERVRGLRDQGLAAPSIAASLNREGFIPRNRRATYNAQMVRQLVARCGLLT